MTALLILIPVALFLGLLGLAAFLWALKSGQFDDLEGAAHRILQDDETEYGATKLTVPDEDQSGIAENREKSANSS